VHWPRKSPLICFVTMGRRVEKERERKRAAASCQMLERFLSKKSKTGEVSSELTDSSVQNDVLNSLNVLMVFSVQLVLFSVPMHQKASLSPTILKVEQKK